ncbi:hypothetical protein DL766_005769 [Monosporascus sp. MC13-8B]|uniref:Peptidase S1 domain-containing protein n=1 Tax=Monosporascus cannonballus TaxID=155416 RepID=A0ABY0HF97_9PEZI|nr:hypothetical protein DL763_006416 [Monosporascus cannonballus]RYO91799.1 hypothetical protein DL762_002018 [Monosporascus cannonballus]RYP28616.1 hypothetical protein DL766_005769 [Monosporascus sp. MC13-8B]
MPPSAIWPGDFTGAQRPYGMDGVRIHRAHDGDETGPLDTNADTYGGQSGGSIWLLFAGGMHALGLISRANSEESTFESGTNFVNHVLRARQHFP